MANYASLNESLFHAFSSSLSSLSRNANFFGFCQPEREMIFLWLAFGIFDWSRTLSISVWLAKDDSSKSKYTLDNSWIAELHIQQLPVWPNKNRQMSIKVAQKWFHQKNDNFYTFTKNCQRMWEILANLLLPMALKTCPKSNKSHQSGHTGNCIHSVWLHEVALQ